MFKTGFAKPLVVAALPVLLIGPLAAAPADDDASVARGRYVVQTAGCNDCHTPGYAMHDGQTPVSQWLLGDRLGWQGPWGTTYAANLRLYMDRMTEDEWVADARTLKRRPPMPWFNVNAMDEDDLRAMYRFVRSLGDPGQPAPDYVPPGQPVLGPVVMFPAPPPGAQASK